MRERRCTRDTWDGIAPSCFVSRSTVRQKVQQRHAPPTRQIERPFLFMPSLLRVAARWGLHERCEHSNDGVTAVMGCHAAVSIDREQVGLSINRWWVLCQLLTAMLTVSVAVPAQSVVPSAIDMPPTLSLDEALRMFHSKGLDLLVAEAAVKNIEGQVGVAGAVPNPVLSGAWGHVLGPYSASNTPTSPCDGCSTTFWSAGLSDSAAIEDSLSGKRTLRVKVVRNALAAAKLSRLDAERTIGF